MLDAILANSGLTYCAMVLALVFFLSFFLLWRVRLLWLNDNPAIHYL